MEEPQQLTVDGRLVPHSQVVRELAGDFAKPEPEPEGYPGTWMPVSGTFRIYPLEPHLLETYDSVFWWSKGHHSADEFIQAVIQGNMDYWGDQPRPIDAERVRHDWWATRQGWGMTGQGAEFTFLYHPVEPTARGAYPVTVVEL